MPISSTSPLSENNKNVSPYSNHVFTSTLDSNLAQKRLIFIGDVHGALAELDSLLAKLEHDPEQDHLVFTGDLIAKGPESLKVVRRVRDLGASCVRGNHDDKVIRWKGYLKSLEVEGTEFSSAKVPEEFKVGSEHEALAKDLSDDLFEFLVSCPIILDIPQYDIYVVHAGLLPDKPLNEHSLFEIMNMRNVDSDGTPTKKKGKGQPWTELWNAAQEKSLNPKIIIYGHDASRGLQINKYSFGLDSGCGSGRELTAMIWDEEKKIVSVPCQSNSS